MGQDSVKRDNVIWFIMKFSALQEMGEGTTPFLSFLHPFVMIWNKTLSAESDIGI